MRITRVEKLTDEKWLNLFGADYEHNNHKGRWVYASRKRSAELPPRVDAVVIVPVLPEPGRAARLVMVREFRVPINAYSLAFPAGLMEDGEAVEECVRRELLEETGLTVTRVRRISPPLSSSPGLTDEAAVLVFVDVEARPGNQLKLEATEDLELCLLDFDEVSRLCDDPGGAVDAKAWCVLFAFQALERLE